MHGLLSLPPASNPLSPAAFLLPFLQSPRQRLRLMCLHLGIISVALLEAHRAKQLRLILPALRLAVLAP